jgi:hypothetical protein
LPLFFGEFSEDLGGMLIDSADKPAERFVIRQFQDDVLSTPEIDDAPPQPIQYMLQQRELIGPAFQTVDLLARVVLLPRRE